MRELTRDVENETNTGKMAKKKKRVKGGKRKWTECRKYHKVKKGL